MIVFRQSSQAFPLSARAPSRLGIRQRYPFASINKSLRRAGNSPSNSTNPIPPYLSLRDYRQAQISRGSVRDRELRWWQSRAEYLTWKCDLENCRVGVASLAEWSRVTAKSACLLAPLSPAQGKWEISTALRLIGGFTRRVRPVVLARAAIGEVMDDNRFKYPISLHMPFLYFLSCSFVFPFLCCKCFNKHHFHRNCEIP